MFLIEIASPSGALTALDRVSLADAIMSGLVAGAAAEEAPEETMRRARRMTHVAFRELADWTTGDGPVPDGAAPPLWVTVTVPEEWREDTARHMLGWLRRAVRRLDADRGWQRPGGDLWINVVGIENGCIGLNGKPSSADDVLEYMTEEFRAALDAGRELPDGVLLDPMCGMTVRLNRDTITLDHDGQTIGFCALGCRSAYARRNGLPVPA